MYPFTIHHRLGRRQLDAVFRLAIEQRPSWQQFHWLEHDDGV
jgi:hypothetical protein